MDVYAVLHLIAKDYFFLSVLETFNKHLSLKRMLKEVSSKDTKFSKVFYIKLPFDIGLQIILENPSQLNLKLC